MKKIIILCLSFISILYVTSNIVSSEVIIPDEAIRFRVIGNSNTVYDQNIKIQIRNILQNEILTLLGDSKDINTSREIIAEHQEALYKLVKEKLDELGYDKDFKIDYGYNYFPKKEYKGVMYKEGYYESLVVTLGEGNGDNFWCVLFPPLCLIESNDDNVTEVEYSFFIKDIIDKYFN